MTHVASVLPPPRRARLTARALDRFAPAATRREIPDAYLPGLYFIVQPSGRKSWAVRYRCNGRTRKYTLGRYPHIRLPDARELARAAFRAIAEGRDPMAERKEARRRARADIDDRDLFARVWDDYRRRHVAGLRPSTAAECERIFAKEFLPRFRARRLSEITKQDVLDLLDDILDRGAPTTANHALATLRAFFNWAIHRNLLAASPCAGIKKPVEVKSRDRVLTDDEIRRLWRACEDIGFPFGPMTQLLLLTGARRDEVRRMTERELDLVRQTWNIPAARTKNGAEHTVHLAPLTLAVLEGLPRIRNAAGYLFTTNGATPCSGFSRAKARLDQLVQFDAPWVIHDLRRTMASGMARLGIALPVIEKCLNHVSGSFAGIVGVYQRHTFENEKRAAFAAWARHVAAAVGGAPTGVVPMRRS